MKLNWLIVYLLVPGLIMSCLKTNTSSKEPIHIEPIDSKIAKDIKTDCFLFKPSASTTESGRPPVKDFTLKSVPVKRVKPEWDTFDILVWQFKTNVNDHHELWEAIGCRGFHIDRGGGLKDAEWAKKKIFYQDHAAGKGYLYLREGEFKNADSGYGTRINLYNRGGWVHPRPRALTDPRTIKEMHGEFHANVSKFTGTKRTLIAFDDEISLGKFASPHEVCGHPESIAEFREWLRWRYCDDIEALNKQWGTENPSIFVVVGGKTKFSDGSVYKLIREQYTEQLRAFEDEYGDNWKPDILRLSGRKMFEKLPPQVFFHPYRDFDEIPAISYEWVRGKKDTPFRKWNLSMWNDFRDYMDYQFSKALMDLTLLGNQLDPECPCGFVGGQAPNAWGGYNYSQITKVIQWIEAYDIGGSNEVIRGLNPDIIRVQTYFPPKSWKVCSWFMSYYLAHQNKCLIMWPASDENSVFTEPGKDGLDGVDEQLKKVAPYTKAIIEEPSRQILASKLKTNPIAIYFSQPSIRVVWALDAECHGNTWPARSISLDNYCNSYHQTLISWFKLLEDLGYQYILINKDQLYQGRLNDENIKVLILPKTLALSRKEINTLKAFAEAGGTIIADHMTGLFDEHGKGLADNDMPVLELFGITRDSSRGWFDESEICELNGERGFGHKGEYDILLAVHKNAKKYMGVPVAENGLSAPDSETIDGTAVMISRTLGKGKTIFMNLSVLPYIDMHQRVFGNGSQIRDIVGGLLETTGITPEVLVYEGNNICPITETLVFEKPDNGFLLCVVKNPVHHGAIISLGDMPGFPKNPIEVTIKFKHPVKNVIDVMTGKAMDIENEQKSITMAWKPWEMLLLGFEN